MVQSRTLHPVPAPLHDIRYFSARNTVTSYQAVLAAWGECEALCDEDLDGDGMVGVSDLLSVLGSWS